MLEKHENEGWQVANGIQRNYVNFTNLGISHNLAKAINATHFVNLVNISSTPGNHLTTLVAIGNINLILYKTCIKMMF